jgi:hypothetical protein
MKLYVVLATLMASAMAYEAASTPPCEKYVSRSLHDRIPEDRY